MSAQKFGINVDLGRYEGQFFDTSRLKNGTSPQVQMLVNKIEELKSNKGYWRQHFVVDRMPTPKQPNGSYAYTIQSMTMKQAPMMDFVTDFAEKPEINKGGHREWTSTIPSLAIGNHDTVLSLEQLSDMIEEYGNDFAIMEQYKVNVGDLISAGESAMDRMAAQTLSTGYLQGWEGQGLGLANPLGNGMTEDKFIEPSVNLQAVDTEILTWYEKFISDLCEDYHLPKKGFFKLSIADERLRDGWAKNEQVIAEVGAWKARQSQGTVVIVNQDSQSALSTSAFGSVTVEDIVAYSKSMESVIPPIEIQVESQNENLLTGIQNGRGWNVNNEVLSPIGMAGVIKWTNIREISLSQKWVSPSVPKTYAYAMNRIIGIMNSVFDNGGYPDFHQDAMMSARPALTDFENRFIIQTNKTKE